MFFYEFMENYNMEDIEISTYLVMDMSDECEDKRKNHTINACIF